MGLTFRKSIRLGGGTRLNLSGSGVGLSTGVKGFRLSTGPRGTYMTVGASGIYYREKIAGPYGLPSQARAATDGEVTGTEQLEPDVDALELVSDDAATILVKINAVTNQPITWVTKTFWAFFLSFFVWAGLAGLLFWLDSLGHPAKGIGALGVAACAVLGSEFIFVPAFTYGCGKLAADNDTERRTYYLHYHLDETVKRRLSAVENAVSILAQNETLSFIDSIRETTDRKRNAGARRLDEYTRAKIDRSKPPLLDTNINPLCLDLGSQNKKLYFMPDRIYVLQEVPSGAVEYGAIEYGALHLEYETKRVIMDTVTAPRDAEVVGETFAKVNKDGSQDLRFKYNPELPICRVGYVTFTSPEGLSILLEVSHAPSAQQFAEAYTSAIADYPPPHMAADNPLPKSFNQAVSNPAVQPENGPENVPQNGPAEEGYLRCPHCGYFNTPLDEHCGRCHQALPNPFEATRHFTPKENIG